MSEPDYQQPDPRQVVPTVTTNTDKMRLDAAIAEIERLTQPQKWIPCKERMPTENDADCYGEVYGCWTQYHPVLIQHRRYDRIDSATHWQPTGLKRPEPPKE